MTRRFEKPRGSSTLFWEISVFGQVVATRWGTIGGKGRTSKTPFTTPALAARGAEKKVQAKRIKGYVEVPVGASAPPPPPADQRHSAWHRIEQWLTRHSLMPDLASGASDADIAAAEQALGVQLPEDYRVSCKLHNGERRDFGMVAGQELLSLPRVVQEWQLMLQMREEGVFDGHQPNPIGPVKDDPWNAKWIPISSSGSGDYFCLDLDPEEGGRVGQVFEHDHERDDRRVVAPSFSALLDLLGEERRLTRDTALLFRDEDPPIKHARGELGWEVQGEA